jgi:hypothetical protein
VPDNLCSIIVAVWDCAVPGVVMHGAAAAGRRED